MKRIFLAAILMLGVIGCSTAYKPKAAGQGYYNYPAATENEYIVGFVGNKNTDATLFQSYTHRHASEMCRDKGLNHYKVMRETQKPSPDMPKYEIVVECYSNY